MSWEKKKPKTACPGSRWQIGSWKYLMLVILLKDFSISLHIRSQSRLKKLSWWSKLSHNPKEMPYEASDIIEQEPWNIPSASSRLQAIEYNSTEGKIVSKHGNYLILLHHKRLSFPLILCSADWSRSTLFWLLETTLHPKNVLLPSRSCVLMLS